ncbi:MAG: hypothetical protein KIT72_02315 [Polyangiaceae bacterium]|nr:hypothetical protein [Polyangiaceae bacterium]MCW5789232.1 hypothetical protein [Polyangiaceae bacterium]
MAAMRQQLDLATYARLLATFAHDPTTREPLLAAQGLTEDDWLAIDEHWQDALDAEGEEEEVEGHVAPLLIAFDRAFSEAQQQLAGAPLDLNRYLEVLQRLRAGHDLTQALAEAGIGLSRYLVSHAHWARRAQEDEAVREALQGGESKD